MERRDILIVDDDRQVREVLHQIFLGANYKCLLANDGHEGSRCSAPRGRP